MEINKKIIKELRDCLDEFNLNEIEYSYKDIKIKVSKKTNTEVISSTPVISEEKNSKKIQQETSGNKVTSPIIGTAYLAPEPGGKKFAEVGKKIKKGDTIMIVEAMKTMNHVPSTFDGTVKEVCVADGQPVEFGQTLIIIE
ncbi:acetyl-CoA carboxylase biotin carboxyl carrier protein subunit [Candidatus Pelagibacter sp.]|jgi:acetyl-CoA carboxylase biotin carboxyl carrier protein|nr:acetyl-CoA carboxylase biotin carboxyl carrier protein subunit [Candidatus Pelagibacter sp.]|tara:strand:+ start:3134 stop:3556 length:423 start_codon:yes stop_codon:yes gene_type:complete